jgi:hypothetical protein
MSERLLRVRLPSFGQDRVHARAALGALSLLKKGPFGGHRAPRFFPDPQRNPRAANREPVVPF